MHRKFRHTISHASVITFACLSLVLAAGVSADGEPDEYEFAPVAGSPVGINPPSALGGGGFVGQIYDAQTGLAGQFSTNILSSEGVTIFDVLGALTQNGQAFVGAVEGTFTVVDGTIVDQHAASLELIVPAAIPGYDGPALTPGYDAFVVATATGDVGAGTRRYSRFSFDGGTSDLYLMMEIDFQQALPPLVVEGSFHFAYTGD